MTPVHDKRSLLVHTVIATISGTAATTAHNPIGWQVVAPLALLGLFYLAHRARDRRKKWPFEVH